jgi:hypothetical protein
MRVATTVQYVQDIRKSHGGIGVGGSSYGGI